MDKQHRKISLHQLLLPLLNGPWICNKRFNYNNCKFPLSISLALSNFLLIIVQEDKLLQQNDRGSVNKRESILLSMRNISPIL